MGSVGRKSTLRVFTPLNGNTIQQVSQVARQTAVTEFSLEAMASGYECLYREAASAEGVTACDQ